MGDSLFGGGTSKINTTLNTNQSTNANQTQNNSGTQLPPDFQMPFLQGGLNAAQNVYGGAPNYTPLAYTGLQPGQFDAYRNLSGFARDAAPIGSSLMATGNGVLGSALSSSQLAASNAFGNASQDPTQSNISSAGQYANNPYTQGMIHAAQTPIERQLTEVNIPGLNSAASGTGNTDSSRSAMAEAILRRSAGEDEANVASNILGSQYNNGLNLAENARVSGINGLLGASSALGSVAGQGAGLIGAGNSLAINDLGIPASTGQAQQQDANAGNQTAFGNFQQGSQYPWQQLLNYWNIAGKPLGQQVSGSSSGTSSGTTVGTNLTNGTQTQPGPGVLGGLLGIGTGIGSFFTPTGSFGMGPSIAKSLFG